MGRIQKSLMGVLAAALVTSGCGGAYEQADTSLVKVHSADGWKVWTYNDPMTGHTTVGVESEWKPNITPLGFPYEDLRARFGFVCGSSRPLRIIEPSSPVHPFILFSDAANLRTEAAWGRLDDGKVLIFHGSWLAGARKLIMTDRPLGGLFGSLPRGQLWHLPRGKVWVVRVKWHQGDATFRFELKGLKEALAAADCPPETPA